MASLPLLHVQSGMTPQTTASYGRSATNWLAGQASSLRLRSTLNAASCAISVIQVERTAWVHSIRHGRSTAEALAFKSRFASGIHQRRQKQQIRLSHRLR